MQAQSVNALSAGIPEPFSQFAPPIQAANTLRQAITDAQLRPEATCLPPLLASARCPDPHMALTIARRLTEGLRARKEGGVEALLHEYDLASGEGIALMCLAEALLRIPDVDTRDALIREKISGGDWMAHLGRDRPLFVNATTWGLLVTGRFTAAVDERGLGSALGRLINRCGEPVIRAGVDLAMRLLGEQFVAGPDIKAALQRGTARERRGYRHSYDMLGEAAMTAADAVRYLQHYEEAIHCVGRAAGGAGCTRGPGVSVKLSALHPRYCRAQAGRVVAELAPRLRRLAVIARGYDIALTIDAEEADRLELSLDLFESLRLAPELNGWDGLGFVVQAYGRRCPYVIDWLIDLGRRSGQRIMVRLVKGAYWDTEIKRAQVAGLSSFPVFTHKAYTDVSWLACARRLLDAGDLVYPQFATHNARSVAGILAMTQGRANDDWEFQCLHGMGEALYDQLLGEGAVCRLYAPVGPQDTLLAYLVRRLLENGANSSFVRLAAETGIPVNRLIADPVAAVESMSEPGAPNHAILSPGDLFSPQRRNSSGIDLASEAALLRLHAGLRASAARCWRSAPVTLATDLMAQPQRRVVNPGDHRDEVGHAEDLAVADAGRVAHAAKPWAASRHTRADCLERAADMLEEAAAELVGLLMREAGKTAAAALGEVREATDFLRYYGAQARELPPDAVPRSGAVLCISPWNFPLAIFTGQIAAALAAGNAVIAKPAELTPLIASEAVRILHVAGIPLASLQMAPGDGALGAALAAEPEISTVLFTGSTGVARKLDRQIADRVGADGQSALLIAETGGLNCMIVDSSALTEQVITDVLASAFDSAGQRCSALRVLCLQEDIAERTLRMLRGAMEELSVGQTDCLSTDIGPVISAVAQVGLESHIERLEALGRRVWRLALPEATRAGTFVAPTIIEIDSLSDVPDEAFGPILHVLRWRRSGLDALLAAINALGYGLTFGVHTRLEGTIKRVVSSIKAGNIYVNRNMVGAVVGSQPFGGRGLSGTGPKAGGPLMVNSMLGGQPTLPCTGPCAGIAAEFADWLDHVGHSAIATAARRMAQSCPVEHQPDAPSLRQNLPGPVGEDNLLTRRPVGTVLLAPVTLTGLYSMVAAVLATGNRAAIVADFKLEPPVLPARIAEALTWFPSLSDVPSVGVALLEGGQARLVEVRQQLAAGEGSIVPTISATPVAIVAQPDLWPLERLLDEISLSINTTAAGGNPGLLLLDADAV